tara:strand:- start:1490 stop:2410 length:921 start_codon:yes stop_codon:yes gene_type:complete
MSILNQKTLKKSVSFSGIGLHTGEKVNLKICPSTPNSGIQFKRIDLKSNNVVIPSVYNVSNATLCTTITNDAKVKVSTIEHLMAALYGLGVDNATIEIDNQEVPILDGSAKYFVEGILKAGLELSNQPIKIIKIEKKISLKEENKFIEIESSKASLDIDFEIKYSNNFIGTQRNKINVFQNDLSEIYSSRTFCLFEDIEKLRKMNLAKGGSLENAIVVKNNEILNSSGLRNSKEFVNHKILDCMGDLFLSGYRLVASIKCSQGGHSLTNKLLRKVFEDKDNFSIFELREKNLPHSFVNKYHLKSIA